MLGGGMILKASHQLSGVPDAAVLEVCPQVSILPCAISISCMLLKQKSFRVWNACPNTKRGKTNKTKMLKITQCLSSQIMQETWDWTSSKQVHLKCSLAFCFLKIYVYFLNCYLYKWMKCMQKKLKLLKLSILIQFCYYKKSENESK